MAEKQRYTVSLPKHVTSEIEKRAKAVDATPTEYAADIIRWWYGQGCPPVTHDEIHLRAAALAARMKPEELSKLVDLTKTPAPLPKDFSVWHLPNAYVQITGDDQVQKLLNQLSLPNLFAHAIEHDEMHSFVAFDNHPTHWLILHLWKGGSLPHQNGLLFEAYPKSSTPAEEVLSRLQRDAREMGVNKRVVFSQIPPVPAPAAAPQHTPAK